MRTPRAAQLGHQRGDECARPSLDDRPSEAMGQCGEEPWEDTREGRGQRQHGVGGGARHEGAAFFALEPLRHVLGRAEPAQPEARGGERVGGHGAHRAQERGQDLVEVAYQGGEGAPCRPGHPHPALRPRSSTLLPTQTARSPSSGWAKATVGVSSRTPRAARSRSPKAGEASSSGCTAEQTSWRKPGSVSSAVRHPPPGSSAASTTSTDSPARASVRAATRPLGPAPTTIASTPLTVRSFRIRPLGPTRRRPSCHSGSVSPSSAPITGTGPSANRHSVRSTSASTRSGRWWNSTTRRAPARAPSLTAYSAAAWPKDPSASTSSARRWASWIKQIDVAGQLERRLVVLADPVGSRTQRRRLVIGDVGQRGPAVADTEPDGAPALVRDVECGDREPLGLERAFGKGGKRPVAAELGRSDREERGGHHPRQQGRGVRLTPLRGQQQRHPGVASVTAAEERESLDVVPVQVAQHHGAAERFVAEELAHAPQTGAGVEEQCGPLRSLLVMRQRDAGGVAAEADELGTRARVSTRGSRRS